MNLKYMLLSLILLTNLSYLATEAITQITSDAQFRGVVAQGKVVVAVGLHAVVIQLQQLAGQLNQISAEIPAKFYFAFAEDIPMSVMQYQLGGSSACAAAFKGGKRVARVAAPVTNQSLLSQLKGAL